jgi:hypothetical protein
MEAYKLRMDMNFPRCDVEHKTNQETELSANNIGAITLISMEI